MAEEEKKEMAEENKPTVFTFDSGHVVTVNHNDEGVVLQIRGKEVEDLLSYIIVELETILGVWFNRGNIKESSSFAEMKVTLSNERHHSPNQGSHHINTVERLRNSIEYELETTCGSWKRLSDPLSQKILHQTGIFRGSLDVKQREGKSDDIVRVNMGHDRIKDAIGSFIERLQRDCAPRELKDTEKMQEELVSFLRDYLDVRQNLHAPRRVWGMGMGVSNLRIRMPIAEVEAHMVELAGKFAGAIKKDSENTEALVDVVFAFLQDMGREASKNPRSGGPGR